MKTRNIRTNPFSMTTLWKAAVIVIASVMFTPWASAGEDALYEAEAPEGSTFVRVFNENATKKIEQVDIGSKSVTNIQPLSASPYIFLPQGKHTIQLNGATAEASLNAKNFYTVIRAKNGDIRILQDRSFTNRRKSLISFYNLVDDQHVSLGTADGKIKVFENIASLENAAREINPVNVSLAPMINDTVVANPIKIDLERGKVSSVFVCGSKDSLKIVTVKNTIDTSV